ncbi:hypothetical protein CDD83_1229 [Cordyceps sp. RAO-2017]|nr:hypothetical protein CDD83_1229 [Cordyceps sp. RAO-2017]
MFASTSVVYDYETLPTPTAFRILELQPAHEGSPISCVLHTIDWPVVPQYEAISYAWGDPEVQASIICHGKRLEITKSLESGLTHLRLQDRSRYLWADAICINQKDVLERGRQVQQMRRIYHNAKTVLIWLGPDSAGQAELALGSVRAMSNFLCRRLGISISALGPLKDVYREVIFENRDVLPLPNEYELSNDSLWTSLIWLYSHSYFTRVWVIQEINANGNRIVHCGRQKIDWDRVELVAGYLIMETAFSRNFGFSNTYCWWAAIAPTERMRQPTNWLSMLYLASNFVSTDARDAIYGLLGLIESPDSTTLLKADYNKTVISIYRDSVEAALVQFQNTDVLLYVGRDQIPSWIPRWNRPMLFRNPFRFGRALPWKPAGDSKPIWQIETESNVLMLQGFVVDDIKLTEPYDESCFGNSRIDSKGCAVELNQVWQRILMTLSSSRRRRSQTITAEMLISAATSFAFGLDEANNPADEFLLLRNFVAYLHLVVDGETHRKYIPADLAEYAREANGRAFGKPVWDFEYPKSSFFITESGLVGCCVAATEPGDTVFVPYGSTYPLVLRPDGCYYSIRGYAYVHGIMRGERRGSRVQDLRIR